MSRIIMQGVGAVSPAGWTAAELFRVLAVKQPLPATLLERPGQATGLPVRRVPSAPVSYPWLRHPRLRRGSSITRFATAAALEALGDDAKGVGDGTVRLGIVFCVLAGCVNYSSRFYQEVLKDPATASPLVFPETVFNAPASHLAAVLRSPAINYTLVGDDTALVQGLATAAGWLEEDRVDGCLVIGAEECDWLTSDAMRLFNPQAILAEGAGAVYLKRAASGVALEAITDPQVYVSGVSRDLAARKVRQDLEAIGPATMFFNSSADGHDELRTGNDVGREWPGATASLRVITGDAFCAASAWQVIAAWEALHAGTEQRAFVTVAGCNQAAIGLSLIRV